MRVNDWEYGKIMLEQDDIESLDDWSDDKEMAYSIMDRRFDYLWDDSKGIHFIDRLKDLAEIDDDARNDGLYLEREENNTLDLWFDSYEDVFRWIIDHSIESKDEWQSWMKERIGA